MKTFQIFFALSLVFLLTACWFVVIPIGPIIRAIQGPRYCVGVSQTIGSRITAAGGKQMVITKIHGEDRTCVNPSFPILVSVNLEEPKK